MKKLIALSTLVILLVVGLNSCKKYEDGPTLSFRSKAARLVGEWKLQKATNEGLDVTDQFQEYYVTFDKNETFTYKRKLFTETGKWAFDSKKENVVLTVDGASTSESYKIIQLKNKELTLEQSVGTQVTRYYYVAL